MTPLLLATHNAHKTREVAGILGAAFSVTDLRAHPHLPVPEETGATFEENAAIKAVAASRAVGGLVLADDSGLEVDALGGAPGVHSARYAGASATDETNRRKLLAAMQGVTNRSARFRCVLALACDGSVLSYFHGTVEGRIIEEERGAGGFGYDPVFIPAGHDRTFAELPAAVKARESHRARALAKFRSG